MPREKDFDQKQVIKKCIDLFANNGYSATGIQEIVEVTRVNRSSLYSTFKGKDALFLTCLQAVLQSEVFILEKMKKDGLNAVKMVDQYLINAVKDQSHLHLLKFANAEFKLLDKKTQATLNNHYQWKRDFWDSVIRTGQKSGKISKKIESAEIASILEMLVHGIQNFSPLSKSEPLFKQPALRFSKLIQKKK